MNMAAIIWLVLMVAFVVVEAACPIHVQFDTTNRNC